MNLINVNFPEDGAMEPITAGKLPAAAVLPPFEEGAARKAGSARFALRERTRAEHDAAEAAFAPFDLSRPDHYRAFLTAHAMMLPRFELGVTGKGWSQWHPRYPQLADDLAALGAPLPAPMLAPTISPVAAWGVQYVLDGSQLGGRVLATRAYDGAPTRYLSPLATMSARWQAFCAALDHALAGDTALLDEATDAAIDTFRSFRRGAEAMVEDIR